MTAGTTLEPNSWSTGIWSTSSDWTKQSCQSLPFHNPQHSWGKNHEGELKFLNWRQRHHTKSVLKKMDPFLLIKLKLQKAKKQLAEWVLWDDKIYKERKLGNSNTDYRNSDPLFWPRQIGENFWKWWYQLEKKYIWK